MADYTLAELPYDYSALEPHISGRIMELHHDKHHATYVTGANTALAALQEARDSENLANVNKLQKDLAFNLAGHVNHTVFWNNLSPDGGDKPTGELAAAIDENFGSFDKFKAHFTASALGIQGSGWSILARSCSSSSSTTTRATTPPRPCRSCCWTCGSTPSTSTTST
jgi:Fe-Mn family superoxide dismutase